MTSKNSTELPLWQRQLLSSSFGALVTSTTMTPLDVIKTRLQIQSTAVPSIKIKSISNKVPCFNVAECLCIEANQGKFNTKSTANQAFFVSQCRYHFENGLDAGMKILKNEGVASLWSGMLPTIAVGSISICFYFTLYEHLRDSSKKSTFLPQTENLQNFVYTPISGVIARTSTCILVNPIEITKVRMQANYSNSTERSFINEMKGLFRERSKGQVRLTSGLKYSIFRDAPFSAIYWMLNELIRNKISSWSDTNSQTNLGFQGSFIPNVQTSISESPFWKSFFAGALAGSVASFATTPFDVIKTRIQTAETKQGQKLNLKQFYKSEGINGLFLGWRQRCLRTSLACALMLGSYEFMKDVFERYQ